jgi:putative FmdB family regulatory protein
VPYYEYCCKNCHVMNAAIHKMEEKFEGPCKYCGGTEFDQLYFPPAISFKGSGFYETDYKNK